MNTLVPVLADAEAWIKLVVILIIVGFSVLGGLVNKVREAQQEAARRARRAHARPPPPRAQGPLADEIEEFLRRAAQRERPGQPSQRPASPPQPARAGAAPSPPPARRPLIERAQRPIEAELVPPTPEPQPESVAEHVQERFGQTRFGRVGSADLGQQVAQTDDQLEERLQEKFGQQLSRLAGVAGEAAAPAAPVEPTAPTDRIAAPPAVAAANLAAVFANPASVRQAVLLSELLNRPEHRWR